MRLGGAGTSERGVYVSYAPEGSKLIAKGGVDLFALSGQVHLGTTQLQSNEYVGVTADTEVGITDSRVRTPSLSIVTFDGLITLQNNLVKFVRGNYAYFSGATVHLTGTRFYGLAPDNLIIEGETSE